MAHALVHGPLREHVLGVHRLVQEEPTALGGDVHGQVLGAEPDAVLDGRLVCDFSTSPPTRPSPHR